MQLKVDIADDFIESNPVPVADLDLGPGLGPHPIDYPKPLFQFFQPIVQPVIRVDQCGDQLFIDLQDLLEGP